MKTIGEIRQLRLQQFVHQTGISYADMNSRLGRDRRDSTLTQVSKAAKNTRTGKPRRMGDAQARLIESTFRLPNGWFDRDPDDFWTTLTVDAEGNVLVEEAARRHGELRISLPTDNLLPTEPPESSGWPFATVHLSDIRAMPAASREALERVMLAFMGSAVAVPDWRQIAHDLAAGLDRKQGSENFSLFVRAIEDELSKWAATPTRKETRREDH